jgi:hypothetical protein
MSSVVGQSGHVALSVKGWAPAAPLGRPVFVARALYDLAEVDANGSSACRSGDVSQRTVIRAFLKKRPVDALAIGTRSLAA